ncbi:MAG: hypothetical protein NTW33_11135, partial [Methanoregula sp.]|nr:hypothetical protein [Methanoregula sp.]
MTARSGARWVGRFALLMVVVYMLVAGVHAAPDITTPSPEPVVYLNMNEGSGQYLLDLSGNGSSGTIHNAARTDNSACSGGLQLRGVNEYVA